MKAGWHVKQLREISKINYGYTESANFEIVGPKFLRITDIQDDQVNWDIVPFCKIGVDDFPKYRLVNGDIVFARTGATTGKSYLICNVPDAVFASYLIRLKLTDNSLLPAFVYLFFQTADYWKSIKDGSSGSAQGGFNATKLADLRISFPQIEQQQRIVAILDQAFEGIAKAHANAEQNLQNARALFESHLQSLLNNKNHDWSESFLGDVCDGLFAGGDVPKENSSKFKTEKYIIPIYSNGEKNKGLYGFTNTARVKKPSITISARGTIGYSQIRNEPFYPAIRLIVVTPKSDLLDLAFLKYLIENMDFIHSGVSIPQLTVPMIKEYSIKYPILDIQKVIVKNLDELASETQRLKALYQRKITLLDELKKSLLQQAFAGECK